MLIHIHEGRRFATGNSQYHMLNVEWEQNGQLLP